MGLRKIATILTFGIILMMLVPNPLDNMYDGDASAVIYVATTKLAIKTLRYEPQSSTNLTMLVFIS
jgi:hypothetical protein